MPCRAQHDLRSGAWCFGSEVFHCCPGLGLNVAQSRRSLAKHWGEDLRGKMGGFLLVGIVGGVSVLLYSISRGMRPGA